MLQVGSAGAVFFLVWPLSVKVRMQRLLAPKSEPCCARAKVSAAQELSALLGWLPLELSCSQAAEEGQVTLSVAHQTRALLRAPQDQLLPMVHTVFIAQSPGLRGPLLAAAALQLLPIALSTRDCPGNPRDWQACCADRLVRLTCKRRRVAALCIALAAVMPLTEVVQRLCLTLPRRSRGTWAAWQCWTRPGPSRLPARV